MCGDFTFGASLPGPPFLGVWFNVWLATFDFDCHFISFQFADDASFV